MDNAGTRGRVAPLSAALCRQAGVPTEAGEMLAQDDQRSYCGGRSRHSHSKEWLLHKRAVSSGAVRTIR
jgi:hypothetical protein